MVPLASLAVLLSVGIAVDFSGHTHSEQDIRDIAHHCAREGAHVTTVSARSDQQAVDQAERCLNHHQVPGTVTITGSTLLVEVEGEYATRLLSLIGVNTLPTRGQGSVDIVTSR